MTDRQTHHISKSKLWTGRGIIFFILLVLLEFVLRGMGFHPGYVGAGIGEYLDFKLVDSLVVYTDLIADENGMYRADFNHPNIFDGNTEIKINSDGFRDEEFKTNIEDKPTVLLIGDSFCWGGNARPITKSFAELLEFEGYHVYNTGIPGVGPPQYQKVAEEYISKLNPDHVVVAFYMANDVMNRDIKLHPGANRYHRTNAGWLDPYIDGDHIRDPKECYQYFEKRFTIPENADFINYLSSKTVISTQVWSLFKKLNLVPNADHPDVTHRKNNNPFPSLDKPVSYEYLKAIQALCMTHNSTFDLCIIPVHSMREDRIKLDHPDLLKDLTYHWPQNLKRDDYHGPPDGHFNNKGHEKYAKFLAEVLKNNRTN